jgi:branched-chain amino acid transport system permease protein
VFEGLVNSAADGLFLGLIYGLAATGLTLIFGVMKVVNLAHGAAITAGMLFVYLLTSVFGLNPYLSIALAIPVGLAIGIGIYLIAIHRVVDAPELMTLLATYAVSLIVVGGGTLLFSTTPHSVSVNLGIIDIGPLHLLTSRALAGILSVLVAGALYGFLYRTPVGIYVRAAADNRSALSLIGVNPTVVLALSFGLGIMLASVAGGLISTLFPFTVLSGGHHELRSFLIVVLGGLGSPAGAIAGGVVLGLVEGLATPFIQVSWVPVLEFTFLVALLLFRPHGLLGRKS